MECDKSKKMMHEYLDEELQGEEKEQFYTHLAECDYCQEEFHALQKTILLLKSQAQVKAPDDFTAKVMSQLPKRNVKDRVLKWMKGHPFFVAASVFLLLMTSSFASLISDGQDKFYVSAPDMDQIIIDEKNRKVIVPEGEVIKGDLIVLNGEVEINGKVKGDVVESEGSSYLASTSHIAKWAWENAKNKFYNTLQWD